MTIDAVGARKAVEDLLRCLGADPSSPELAQTPQRVAEFWMERLAGQELDPAEELVPLPGDLDPCPVLLERVPFVSTCEHHLAPFEGLATIGYVPGEGGTVGLSKLVKLVQGYANRLQVQERLTHQIASTLASRLRPAAWGVKLVARHTCMAHRGVRTPDVPVTTLVLGGTWLQSPPHAFL